MRVLHFYRYAMGTKIPFDQLPGIIDQFLHSQGLTHRVFHYCLTSVDNRDYHRSVLDGSQCEHCGGSDVFCERCRSNAADYLRKGTGCERAAREHPFLGPIHIREEEYADRQLLHNFSEESNGAKADIYAILTKIYRRYGFSDTSLIYRDIDFFSRRVPAPAPDAEFLMGGYQGPGITLYRGDFPPGSVVMMNVESSYPGDVPDASVYAEALKAHLNCKKYLSATRLILSPEEEALYDSLNARAKPLVRQAHEFFNDRMPEEKGSGEPADRANVASWLKKLGKRYGYTYLGYENYLYFMEKRLPGGHYVCLEFVSNPLSPDADPYVNLCGLGFKHEIWIDGFSPQNPKDACEYLTRLFEVLAEAENTVFREILDLYPETPHWFIPTH